ncbi:MAG: type II toxin-antitoxin system HicA family toxin [Halobacteriales archaeon]|nr:type II toxin-antitoxin system HicA family toxin [Halobacteriales archaeon]
MGKALNRLGFVQVRQRGSHATFHHPGRDREVTVPMKPAIAVGTLASILRQADLGVGEFLGAL